MALTVCAPAAAADKPKPKPTESMRMMAPKVQSMAVDPYELQKQTYKDAMQARTASIEVINQAFSAAVKQAQLDYRTARAAAKTADAKSQADANRRASIAAASTARQKAIDALGPIPQKPERPATGTP